MSEKPAGFREVEHTADWELAIWAPDLAGLLEQAARGMYALSGTSLASAPRRLVEFRLSAADPESLLVMFLSELSWLGGQDNLGFDVYQLSIQDSELLARLEGAPIVRQTKTIKAVTYHKLAINQTERGLDASVVFDV